MIQEKRNEGTIRFDRFHSAFWNYCYLHDNNEKMVEDVNECFEEQISPFDPDKLFLWQELYNVEIRKGKYETIFEGEERLRKKVIRIDRVETEEFDTNGRCSSGSGIELWMTDSFEFFTTRYTEVAEWNERGNRILTMSYRTVLDKDFYTIIGEFRSEDFLEIIKDLVDDSRYR